MTLLLGVLILPFFIWAWIRHGADEDADAAVSIMAWLVLGVGGTAIAYFLLR